MVGYDRGEVNIVFIFEFVVDESFDDGGSFSYNIPVPNSGNYLLRLHFAEIFHGIENSNGIGSRILEIDVEGGQALISDFDIINQVGASATASERVIWSSAAVLTE